MNTRQLSKWIIALAVSSAAAQDGVEVVDGPDISKTNVNYIGNRAPLEPSRFIMLPVDAVEPQGWLREFLNRQRGGLTGHLGEISAWLQKEDNAWLSKNGKGKYGWEELPYWLKGYIELGYIFKDPKMMAESKTWIEGALASQRPNGDFGPDEKFEDGSRDYWANMIMLFCLQSYHDHTNDPRVLELMTKYFHYQLTVPDDAMLTHYWQKMRGGDNLQAIHWLYNRTGDPDLLKLGEKIHRCTADWTKQNDLPNWHNVNIAECFREPAQYYLQSKSKTDLAASYANFLEVRKRYGQVPGGMFGGDENCRPGYDDPRQAVETCGMVEQMLSDEMLMQITGDPFWADHCEEVAFNSYPAAVMPDFTSLRYLTAPNMVASDGKNHAPGIDNTGPFLMMNPFSSRCCQHNHSHGWPYFAKNLWLATPDNGVCAAMYSASEVSMKVADGTTVHFTEDTRYPFEDTIRFKFRADQAVEFPIYLRIPAWCKAAKITINGKPAEVAAKAGKYVRISRGWTTGDVITLQLPMEVSVKKWTANHDSVSVNYGPLTFSLKIGERYDRHDSTKTAIGDSSWQKGADPSKWPSYEIQPTTPWNYGLVLDPQHPEKSFTVKQGTWPANNFPFTTDATPITMQVKAKRIPEWTLDRHGLCAVLQDSPAASNEAEETVTLIPMGAARLRISSFPQIGNGPRWSAPAVPRAPLYKTSASHCFSGDSVDAIQDGMEPASSNDKSFPRLTWWDHRGTHEWAQYDFPAAKEVSEVAVYWFDDTGVGQCRLPKSWRLLYQDNGNWKPVTDATAEPVARDRWNHLKFKSIKTTALRLEAELQPQFSGGILEWQLDPQGK
jgi:Beta-L-arabinofuranosidase, GH127